MDVADLAAAARARLPGLLVATDFDGTLAPIVADPQQSRPAPDAIEALRGLAERGARVAVITGRDAATVVRLGGLDAVPRLVVEGLYGLERWQDGTIDSPDVPPAMAELGARLPDWLRTQDADPGVWVEDKRLSYVVHTRRAIDPAATQAALRNPARALAAAHGIEVHDGRDVLEFRLPGYDKGGALRRLAAEFGAPALIYAGDDLGDLPAFDAARALGGWTVGATSAEVPDLPADVLVDGPPGVVELFRAIAS